MTDLRDPSTTPLNFTKSINLALSERGIHAMQAANRRDLIESVMAETIPMRGRMIHGMRVSGELYEEGQDYDIHGRVSQHIHFLNNQLEFTINTDYIRSRSWWLKQAAAR